MDDGVTISNDQLPFELNVFLVAVSTSNTLFTVPWFDKLIAYTDMAIGAPIHMITSDK